MIRSASPLRAFTLMDDMRLLPLVFPLPRASDPELLPADGGSDRGSRDSVYEMGMVYLKVQGRHLYATTYYIIYQS